MKLDVFVVDGQSIDIRPAPATRDWMDSTNSGFAYRCLPLNIANAHGWEILCPQTVSATWNGARGLDAVAVTDGGEFAISHFGNGILTFRVQAVFRTAPGYDLMVQGPVNRPKDGIGALSGIIETDWSPYTFTMNWLFTRAGTPVVFEKGEPICHFFPVKRGLLETVVPRLRPLSSDPELKATRDAWYAGRKQFLADLRKPGSVAHAQKWQKHYYRGRQPDGVGKGAEDHRIKLRLKPFAAAGGRAGGKAP